MHGQNIQYVGGIYVHMGCFILLAWLQTSDTANII